MALEKVAIAGATGKIGPILVKALVESGHFHVTLLSRHGKEKSLPEAEHVTIRLVDYDNETSLVDALQGQDAVVSALPPDAASQQSALLNASVTAGVQRFLPSEFGSDTQNGNAAKLPVFASKKEAEQRLEELAAQNKISFTYVITGPWLDFGLSSGFLGLDLKRRQVRFLDGGNAKFSTSTLPTAAKAVVQILLKPEETKNRAVYVQDTAVSLKDLFRLAKQVLGEDGWTEVDAGTTEEVESASWAKLESGHKDLGVFLGFLMSAIYRPGYGGHFSQLDNHLLGIHELTEDQMKELIAAAEKQ